MLVFQTEGSADWRPFFPNQRVCGGFALRRGCVGNLSLIQRALAFDDANGGITIVNAAFLGIRGVYQEF